MKGRKPNIPKAKKIVSVHFTIDTTTKIVSVPDKFKESTYPQRTQKALKHLQTNGYHLQTSIN